MFWAEGGLPDGKCLLKNPDRLLRKTKAIDGQADRRGTSRL